MNSSQLNFDNDWTIGTAYIVETREHPNLFVVIENACQSLPEGWILRICHGPDNKKFCQNVSDSVKSHKIELSQLDKNVTSTDHYNELMFNILFWESFETENLLCFQVDSLFNAAKPELLESLCGYDYVGAPWSERIQARWEYIPSIGGNGGCCFSKRSSRIKALNVSSFSHFSGPPDNQKLPEDIWFSHAINDIGGNIPDRALAESLLVESVFSSHPFAIHKPWAYLTAKQVDELAEEFPLITTIRSGYYLPKKIIEVEITEDVDKQDYRRFLLSYARERMNSNNWYFADLALQVCQSRHYNDPAAYNLQAMLAYKLGLYENALVFANRALKKYAKYAKAIENKEIIQQKIDERLNYQDKNPSTESKYLLIHAWGSGIGFDLLHVLQYLLVAELTNRCPIIYWGENSLYNENENDCFADYFQAINDLSIKDIDESTEKIFPGYWNGRELNVYLRRTKWRNTKNNQSYKITAIDYLNKSEKIVVSGEFTNIKSILPWVLEDSDYYGKDVKTIYKSLTKKYIKPKHEFINTANSVIKNKFNNSDFIAIHLRGTDKSKEKQSNDIASINDDLIKKVSSLDSSLPIFLMTDDIRQLAKMTDLFGNRLVSLDVTRSQNDDIGVHYESNEKKKIAAEVIIDVLVASKAKYFLGCGFSYLACIVSYLADEAQESTLLPYDINTRFYDIPQQPLE